MEQITFNYRNTEYLITYEGEGIQDAKWYRDQLQHCLDTSDFIALNNKITAGLAWGYVERIEKNESRPMPELDNFEDSIL